MMIGSDRLWIEKLRSFPHEQLHKRLGRRGRRGRILSSNETAIDYSMALPILCFFVQAADPFQLIFNQEWHDLRQMNCFLFTIGETGHALALDQRSAVVHYTMEDGGRMADCGDRLA